jgi:ribose 5-phosphate isomerase B
MKVAIAADHGGFEFKEKLKEWLKAQGHEVIDVGAFAFDAVDSYADFVKPLVDMVRKDNAVGIFACRTGNGPAMMANKFKGIRAAVCVNEKYAFLAREHNDANVICLGGDMMTMEETQKAIDVFLGTPFGGGRHIPRIGAFENLGEK